MLQPRERSSADPRHERQAHPKAALAVLVALKAVERRVRGSLAVRRQELLQGHPSAKSAT